MRKCSEQKKNNNDNRIKQDMAEILAYCEQHGHRPPLRSVLDKRMLAIYTVMYKRRNQESGCPHYLSDGIQAISEYPTELEYRQTQIRISKIQQNKDRERLLKKSDEISKIFPMVKLLRVLLDEESYMRFLDKEENKFALHIFSDYLSFLVNKHIPTQSIPTVLKYAGIGVSDEDILSVRDCYAKSKKDSMSLSDKDRLSIRELSHFYGLTRQAIAARICVEQKRFKYQLKLQEMYDKYMADDIRGMLAISLNKLHNFCEFEQKYNMIHMPVKELVDAGQILFSMMDCTQQQLR